MLRKAFSALSSGVLLLAVGTALSLPVQQIPQQPSSDLNIQLDPGLATTSTPITRGTKRILPSDPVRDPTNSGTPNQNEGNPKRQAILDSTQLTATMQPSHKPSNIAQGSITGRPRKKLSNTWGFDVLRYVPYESLKDHQGHTKDPTSSPWVICPECQRAVKLGAPPVTQAAHVKTYHTQEYLEKVDRTPGKPNPWLVCDCEKAWSKEEDVDKKKHELLKVHREWKLLKTLERAMHAP